MSLCSSFRLSDNRPEHDRKLTDTLAGDDAGHPQATHACKEPIETWRLMVTSFRACTTVPEAFHSPFSPYSIPREFLTCIDPMLPYFHASGRILGWGSLASECRFWGVSQFDWYKFPAYNCILIIHIWLQLSFIPVGAPFLDSDILRLKMFRKVKIVSALTCIDFFSSHYSLNIRM